MKQASCQRYNPSPILHVGNSLPVAFFKGSSLAVQSFLPLVASGLSLEPGPMAGPHNQAGDRGAEQDQDKRQNDGGSYISFIGKRL